MQPHNRKTLDLSDIHRSYFVPPNFRVPDLASFSRYGRGEAMQWSEWKQKAQAVARAPGVRPRAALILVLGCVLLLVGLFHRSEDPPTSTNPTRPDALVLDLPPTPEPGLVYGPPTPQTAWDETDNPSVYMPTGSGRVASAGYGSVRTRSSGRASFHEGVDIAPVNRDRAGRALDDVFAVAKGEVAYINRVAGNSSFGKYVVLTHDDPVGEVITLYAHLASAADGLREGDSVTRGQVIGRMGHTSTLGIPRRRSHLHLETGMLLNSRFNRWYASEGLSPDHDIYHGYNLAGLDPMNLLSRLANRETTRFSFLQTIKDTPVAWRILLPASRRPDYFDRYPALWEGEDFTGDAVVLDVSESGVPLAGRNPTPEERARLGSDSHLVLDVNEEALGRNGLRHIVPRGDGWRLARNGERWRDILMYGAQR